MGWLIVLGLVALWFVAGYMAGRAEMLWNLDSSAFRHQPFDSVWLAFFGGFLTYAGFWIASDHRPFMLLVHGMSPAGDKSINFNQRFWRIDK